MLINAWCAHPAWLTSKLACPVWWVSVSMKTATGHMKLRDERVQRCAWKWQLRHDFAELSL